VRRSCVVVALAAALAATGCGGGGSGKRASRGSPAVPEVELASVRAPAWVERLLRDDVRQAYTPDPCPKPCPPFLRRSRTHVLRLRHATALPPGRHPHAVARARLRDGMTVTFYAYRSEAGHLCDYVVVTAGTRPVTAGLSPGLPCVPGAPCGAVCLMQLHCCGTNVVVGTVTMRADRLATRYDEGPEVRYRLAQPAFPGRPRRRLVVLDVRPHDVADPIRLLAGGKTIASGTVAGIG
jgi:hypothetical protein